MAPLNRPWSISFVFLFFMVVLLLLSRPVVFVFCCRQARVLWHIIVLCVAYIVVRFNSYLISIQRGLCKK